MSNERWTNSLCADETGVPAHLIIRLGAGENMGRLVLFVNTEKSWKERPVSKTNK